MTSSEIRDAVQDNEDRTRAPEFCKENELPK